MRETSGPRSEIDASRALGASRFSQGDYVGASRIYADLIERAPSTAADFENLIVSNYMLKNYGQVTRDFDRYCSGYQPKFKMVAYVFFAACMADCEKRAKYLSMVSGFSGVLLERHLKLGAEIFHSLADSGYIEDAYSFKHSMAELCSRAAPFRSSPYITYQIIAALVFLGKFAQAKKVVESAPLNYDWGDVKKIYDEISLFCMVSLSDALHGGGAKGRAMLAEARASTEQSKDYAASDEYFKDLIYGKSVAIVGPADAGCSLKDEIDSYDVVVRTNVFSEDDYVLEEERIGSAVDVSYYTRATALIRKSDLIDFGRRSSAVFVFRSRASVREFGKENLRVQDRIISTDICPFMPFYRAMHAIQRISWDLLKYGPRTLKVFNANFFVGEMYHDKYRPRGKAPGLKSLGMQHDPLQSFMFSKKLNELGLVEYDDVASNVLEMSEIEYIRYLQDRFGTAWRCANINNNLKV